MPEQAHPLNATDQSALDNDHLLEEYRANVELWKHDDLLRQERDKKFLAVNTILVVALGAFLQIDSNGTNVLGTHQRDLGAAMMLLAVTGLMACTVWHLVLARNAEYVRFRRMHLRAIERQLRTLNTFENMYRSLNNEEDIYYPSLGETFVVEKLRGKLRSTVTEGRLPAVAGVFWALVLLLAVLLLSKAP